MYRVGVQGIGQEDQVIKHVYSDLKHVYTGLKSVSVSILYVHIPVDMCSKNCIRPVVVCFVSVLSLSTVSTGPVCMSNLRVLCNVHGL